MISLPNKHTDRFLCTVHRAVRQRSPRRRGAFALSLSLGFAVAGLALPAARAANDAYSPDATSGLFSTSFTDGTTTPTAGGTSAPVTGDSLYFGTETSGTTTVNDDLTAGTVFAALNFTGTSAFTISGNAFTLGTATAATAFANTGGVLQTISNNITLGAAVQTVALTSGGLTLGGTTAVTSNATGLTLTGGGTLTINATGTISGTGSTTTNAVVLANTAGETLTIGNSATVTGVITGGGATGGALSIGSGSTFISNAATATVTFAGTVSGAGTLEVGYTGANHYSFTPASISGFTGVLDFDSGDVRSTPQGSSPSYTLELAGATVNSSGDYTNANGTTAANNIELASNGGYIRYNGTAGETLSGSVTGTGTFVLAQPFNLTGNWTSSNSFTSAFAGTVQIGAATGNATGAGTVSINTATSSDANAAYVLVNGTVAAPANSTLNSGLASGGTVNLGSLASTLNGSFGGIVENNVASTTATFSIGALGTGTSFAGVIQNGTGTAEVTALAKVGAGTLTLSGANTYTGTTSVSAGALLVNGSIGTAGTPAGAVSVTVGTLGGTGILTLAGATINGTLAPGATLGATTGTLTVNTTSGLTLSGGALVLALGTTGTNGTLLSTGALTLTATTLTLGGVTPNGSVLAYDLVNYSGTIGGNGAFTGFTAPPGYTISYTGSTFSATDIELVAVPEPSAWVAVMLGCGALSLRWRRRSAGTFKLPSAA